jgi:hypothetical protein
LSASSSCPGGACNTSSDNDMFKRVQKPNQLRHPTSGFSEKAVNND